jgi:hypothetical protein
MKLTGRFYVFMLVCTLSGCSGVDEFIPLDLDGKPEVHASVILIPDSTVYLRISNNKEIGKPENQFSIDLYKQMTARVSSGDQQWPFVMWNTQAGTLPNGAHTFRTATKVALDHGKTYAITVDVPGYPTMNAQTMVKRDASARLVLWDSVGSPTRHRNEDNQELRVIFELTDNPGRDYYFVQFGDYGGKDGVFPSGVEFAINLPRNPAFAPNPLRQGPGEKSQYLYNFYAFSDDVLSTGKSEIEIRFPIRVDEALNVEALFVWKIGKEYFDYLSALWLSQSLYDIPYTEPVQVPTNFDIGAGIFSWAIPVLAFPLNDRGRQWLKR